MPPVLKKELPLTIKFTSLGNIKELLRQLQAFQRYGLIVVSCKDDHVDYDISILDFDLLNSAFFSQHIAKLEIN